MPEGRSVVGPMASRSDGRPQSSRAALLPEKLCGKDVDSLFSYTTAKRVKIKDAKLGLLFYVLFAFIAVYILIYQLYGKGGYMLFEIPRTAVRLTLQQPTIQDGHPCNPNEADCNDDFPLPSDLPYCWSPNKPFQKVDNYKYGTYNCTYMDGQDAAVTHEASIMMSTLIHAYRQTRDPRCGDDSEFGLGNTARTACSKLWKIDQQKKWYVVDPENFTMLLDHAVVSDNVVVNYSTAQGYLFVDQGSKRQDDLCREKGGVDSIWESGLQTTRAPCYLMPDKVGGGDVFSVGQLLQAIGLSMDDPSQEEVDPGDEVVSIRYSGLIVRMDIDFVNFRRFHPGAQSTVRYVYKPRLLPGSTYKATRIVNTEPTQRIKQDLHGILFEVKAVGSLGSFEPMNMLLKFAASLALFTAATSIVDLLATHVLKHAWVYKRAIYSSTPDLGDLEKLDSFSDEDIDMALRAYGVHFERPEEQEAERSEKMWQLMEAGWPDKRPPGYERVPLA